MDINRLVQMVVNLFVRKAVNKGVTMAVDRMSKGRGPATAADTDTDTDQTRAARETVKRARKAASLTRKIGR